VFHDFTFGRAAIRAARKTLVATLVAGVTVGQGLPLRAQPRYDDRDEAYRRLTQIEPWSYVTVRTTQPIDVSSRDGRIFSGVIDEDVWDDQHRLAIPAIPRGSPVELIVRSASDRDLILDLESVTVSGRRYAVVARVERVEAARRDDGGRAAQMVGGGALLGTIIGAIAGGGKGAAIGAAAGAAVGTAALVTQGPRVRVPARAILTFQLQRGLYIDAPDQGFGRNGRHFHRD
jgi:hypothetical protein